MLSFFRFARRAAVTALLPLCLPAALRALPADFERVTVVSGLNFPQCMKFAPDGRLFLGMHGKGEIAIVKEGKLLATPFAKVPININQRENIIGLAVDPEFAKTGHVYLFYYADVGGSKRMRISRFQGSAANPDVSDGTETVILDSIFVGVYTGGATFFGADGMLYAATGHGASQDSTNLEGKLIRIDARHWPDIIPKDNPFVGRPRWRPEIWALGFREPFTGAADPVTGRIVVNDVGESFAEELDLIQKGGNYGFPICEGNCAKPGMANPWQELRAADPLGRYNVVTGGAFYRGGKYPPEYNGAYFFGDHGKQKIHVKRGDDSAQVFDSYNLAQYIQFDVNPVDGLLYMLDIRNTGNSTVQRLDYKGQVGLAPSGPAPGMRGRLGPEFATAAGRCAGFRFLLGEDPVREARVVVMDVAGHVVADERGAGRSGLELGAGGWPTGTYAYALSGISAEGRAFAKRGLLHRQ